MSYAAEVAKMLLTGEWLPLTYVAGLVDRDVHTIKDWVRCGRIRVHSFGPKKANLYYVSDVIKADNHGKKWGTKKYQEESLLNRIQWYRRLRETLLTARPMCWNYKSCKNPADQLAHIVANTKANHKRYGWWAINHEMNVRTSCERCNAKAMSIVRGDAERDEFVKKIHGMLESLEVDPWSGPTKKR